MTLRLIDGFDWLPANDGQAAVRNWFADGWFGDVSTQGGGLSVVQSNAVRFADRPNPGLGMGFQDMTFGKGVNRTLNGTRYEGEFVIGHAFRIGGETDGTHSFTVYDTLSTGGTQFTLNFVPDGSIRFTAATPTGQFVSGAPAGTLYAGSWCYVEVKFTIGEEAVFEVRVNTKVVLSFPALHIQGGNPFVGYDPGFDILSYSCSGGGGGFGHSFVWDDFYMLDTTGAVNNDYLGNVRVNYQNVIGQDAVQWLIGGNAPAPTNWQSVISAALDDAKYVKTRVTGNRDLYNVNPSINSAAIYGVQVKGAYKLDDAGQRWIRNTAKTAVGTDLLGVSVPPDQTYRYYQDIFELNPDTGVGWTDLEVNALLIGPEDTTP